MSRTDSLGQAYTLTGLQAFASVRNNLAAAGAAAVSDAPALVSPDGLLTLVPTATAPNILSLAYTATPLGAAQKLFIYASPQRSAGRNYEGDLRLVMVSAAAAASPQAAGASYVSRYGNMIVGRRVFVACCVYEAGFLSAPIQATAVVA